jgi:[NiFe] hydrogenase assembly HybE family chaperone
MSERFECGVCWWLYDPAAGDPARQIPPGTAFDALPEDWTCPSCDSDRVLFLSLEAGSGRASPNAARARNVGESADDETKRVRDARLRALLDDYREVMERKMAGLPIINPRLEVAATGFAPHDAGQLGIVITPWLLSAVWIPDLRDDLRRAGEVVTRELPSGSYELNVVRLHRAGAIESLSLLSPVDVLTDMVVAREAAAAALAELLGDGAEEAPSLGRRSLFARLGGRG